MFQYGRAWAGHSQEWVFTVTSIVSLSEPKKPYGVNLKSLKPFSVASSPQNPNHCPCALYCHSCASLFPDDKQFFNTSIESQLFAPDFCHLSCFQGSPCCSMYLEPIRCYCWILFYCMGTPHLVYPFICWWIFGLFPVLLWVMPLWAFMYKSLCGYVFIST